jgi:pyrroline-5-carboxylate reductase
VTQTNIAFIGSGNMATSLISGLINKGQNPATIWASDPSEVCRSKTAALGVNVSEDNNEIAHNADVIVIAVKPQALKQVALPLKALLEGTNKVVISIAAGVDLTSLQAWLGDSIAIVRCMPNTPSLLGLGATGLYGNGNTTTAQKELASSILNAVGVSVWVDDEAALDAVTAVSGSGPAYYFLLMEAMQEVGIKMGLDAQTSKLLTLQTALGAAQMALDSDVEVDELRRRVTSPAGTTEQAVNTFEAGGLRELVEKAMNNCAKRAREMAKELGE